MKKNAWAILFIIACITGCTITDSNEVAPDVEVIPGLQTYVYSDTAQISLQIINHSTRPVYFGGCDQQEIEILRGHTVSRQFRTFSTCRCLCIVDIQPGEMVQFPFQLFLMGQTGDPVLTDQTYRIWPVFYEQKDFMKQLPRHTLHIESFYLSSRHSRIPIHQAVQ